MGSYGEIEHKDWSMDLIPIYYRHVKFLKINYNLETFHYCFYLNASIDIYKVISIIVGKFKVEGGKKNVF